MTERQVAIKRLAAQSIKAALCLLFPPCCHLCKALVDTASCPKLCDDCERLLEVVGTPLCTRCGMPFEALQPSGDHHCSRCLTNVPPFDSARSLLRYSPPVPELLHRMKYRNDNLAIGAIEYILKQKQQATLLHEPDILIPVPLHRQRLKVRGFNQALLLARLAFPCYRKKIAVNLLERVKNTRSQTGLSGAERHRNIQDGFQVFDSTAIEGKTIYLIDDVYTTGATVSECSKTLRKNGATEVHVWTLARV